jgi:hypothetical protein
MSLQRTSAPASTSAIAVTMWPFADAMCSAVTLRRRKPEQLCHL